MDDLYASVGYGGLTAQKVVMRLREEYIRDKRDHPADEPPKTTEPKRRHSNSGVNVAGIDNCLVRLAKCCNPVPGDEIVGFITKGRGVSVHRADCPNIQPSALTAEDKLRFIGVSWAEEKRASYIATLQVDADNRPGMMMAVSAAMADLKINCASITARVTKQGYAVMTFGLEISDMADVKKAMNKIRQIPGVMSVSRTTN